MASDTNETTAPEGPDSASNATISSDYDLSQPINSTSGLRQGLTSYGDAHFSLFLRKVFIKALGYSDSALSSPIIGIINTYSSFNPCHSNVPQLIESVKRGVLASEGCPWISPRSASMRVSPVPPACTCGIS